MCLESKYNITPCFLRYQISVIDQTVKLCLVSGRKRTCETVALNGLFIREELWFRG
jgi:hypothetical protein